MPNLPVPLQIFRLCVTAIKSNKLVSRANKLDKEFHFQNWFKERLSESHLNFEDGGRNSYPDFRLVASTDGFEIKGLAYPGREATYDANSQVPTGSHKGRAIYYVFGRYPAVPDGERYPVLDLAICHGDFLNADHEYEHKNKSVKGFGSYGDIMIRDRKMYVAPTPFGLTRGTAHQQTLILPADFLVTDDFKQVGQLVRVETSKIVVGYSFDLKTNTIRPDLVDNPNSGKEHAFVAYRLADANDEEVSMRPPSVVMEEVADEAAEDD